MSSSSTSHGYFESVSTQLSLSVGSSFEGVAGNSSANASQGISAGVSAVAVRCAVGFEGDGNDGRTLRLAGSQGAVGQVHREYPSMA